MKKLMEIISGLSGIILAIFFVFVALDVLFRSVVGMPITWLNEGSTYLFMWMAFISGGIAFFHDTHYKMNLFTEKFEKKIDFFLTTCEVIAVLVFAGILFWYGMVFVQYSMMKYSPALGMNMAGVISVLPFTGAVVIVAIIYRYYLAIKRRKGTARDTEGGELK